MHALPLRPPFGAGLRRLSVLLTALVAVCLTSAASAADDRIAVVDTQRAVMETEDGLRAQATLKKLFDQRQRELDKKQQELQKERETLEKSRGQMGNEEMAKRIEKWQKEMAEVQNKFMQYNQELQKKQNELTAPIVRRTVELIRRLATKEGYAMVIERQAAPYVRPDLDLTDRVITMYNQDGSTAKK